MRQAYAQHITCHLVLAMVAVMVLSCTTLADRSAKDSGGPYTQRTLLPWTSKNVIKIWDLLRDAKSS